MNNLDIPSLFLDKIRLSAMIIQKEGQMVGEFNTLIIEMKKGFVNERNMGKDRVYLSCIGNIKELFDILEFNKLKDMSKNYKFEFDRLKLLLDKYSNLTENLSFSEVKEIYSSIRLFISLSGYHDDEIKKDKIIDDTPENF